MHLYHLSLILLIAAAPGQNPPGSAAQATKAVQATQAPTAEGRRPPRAGPGAAGSGRGPSRRRR